MGAAVGSLWDAAQWLVVECIVVHSCLFGCASPPPSLGGNFPHVGGGGRLWRPPTWHVVVRARTCRRRLDTSLGAGATRQDPAILLPDWRLAVVRWLCAVGKSVLP